MTTPREIHPSQTEPDSSKRRSNALIVVFSLAHVMMALFVPRAFARISGRSVQGVLEAHGTLIWLVVAVTIAGVIGVAVLGAFMTRRPQARALVLALPALTVLAVAQASYRSTGGGAAGSGEVFAIGALSSAVTCSAAALAVSLVRGGVKFGISFFRTMLVGSATLVLVAVFAARQLQSSIGVVPALFGVLAVSYSAASAEQAGQTDEPVTAFRIDGDMLIVVTLSLVAIALVAFGAGTGRSLAAAELPADVAKVRQIIALAWAHSLAVAMAALSGFAIRARLVGLSAIARKRELFLLAVAAAAIVIGARLEIPVAAAEGTVSRTADKRPLRGHGHETARPKARAELAKPADELASARSAAPPADASAPERDAQRSLPAFRLTRVEGILQQDAETSLRRRMEWFTACADKHVLATGSVRVELIVDRGGSVRNVVDKSQDQVARGLVTCTLLAVYRVGFPPPHEGTARISAVFDYDR